MPFVVSSSNHERHIDRLRANGTWCTNFHPLWCRWQSLKMAARLLLLPFVKDRTDTKIRESAANTYEVRFLNLNSRIKDTLAIGLKPSPVGWVKRSVTHHLPKWRWVMSTYGGLHPPYE